MTQTARFKIAYLQAAQLAKETTVNEGFAALDIAISAAVDGVMVDAPPANPTIGDCYVVGGEPEGAWVGHALSLAGYTEGGWRFIGSAATIERDCSDPQATLSAAEVALLGTGTIDVEVRQIGTLALSKPQIITIAS